MNERPGRVERLLNLVSALLSAERPMAVSDILAGVRGYDEPDVVRGAARRARRTRLRRLERDLAALRQLGLPLERSKDGWLLSRQRYGVKPLTMDPVAFSRLAALRQQPAAIPAFAEALATGLAKLECAAASSGNARDHVSLPMDVSAEWLTNRSMLERLTAIARSVVDRGVIRILYCSATTTSGVVAREVEPHAMACVGGVFYFSGYCRRRSGVRVFRVDRLRGPVVDLPNQDRETESVDVGDLGARLRRPLWSVGEASGAPLKVRVALPGERAWYAVRAHSGLIVEERPGEQIAEGEVVVEFRVRRRGPFLDFLLGHAPAVRVLSPRCFAGELNRLAERAAHRHAEGAFVSAGPCADAPAVPGYLEDSGEALAEEPWVSRDLARLGRVLTAIALAKALPGIGLGDLANRFGVTVPEMRVDLDLALLCGVPPYAPHDYVSVVVDEGRVWVEGGDHLSVPPDLVGLEPLALGLCLEALQDSMRGRLDHTPEVLEALALRRSLHIDYWSASSGSLQPRRVEPVGLVERDGTCYLVARENPQACPRSFRLDRIRRARPGSADSAASTQAAVRESLGRVARGPLPDHGVSITVLMSREAVSRCANEQLRTLGQERDGRLRVERQVGSLSWAAGWILEQGDGATALEPEPLRHEVHRRALALTLET